MQFLGARTLAVVMLVNNFTNKTFSSINVFWGFENGSDVKNLKVRLDANALADRNRLFFNLIKQSLKYTGDLFSYCCLFPPKWKNDARKSRA